MSTSNRTTLRAVGYGRGSTLRQEASVEDQLAWINRVASHERLDLVRVFSDCGVVGDTMNRPGLNDLVAFVDAEFYADRQIDALIIWDLDRFSRSSSLHADAVLADLFNAGVTRILTKDGWTDLESAIDLLMMNVRTNFQSSGYVRSLSAQVLRTVHRKAKDGKRTGGRVPRGYRVGENHQLELGDPADVELVQWIFRTYATRDTSTTEIARDLQARKVPASYGARQWRANSVRTILINRAYLGEFRWFTHHTGKYHVVRKGEVGKVEDLTERKQDARRRDLKYLPHSHKEDADTIIIPNAHPAIIDEATFAIVQARIAANSHRRGAAKPTRWPLSGMMVCGCCRQPLWCMPSTRKGPGSKNVLCSLHKTMGPSACSGGGRLYHIDVLRRVVELLVQHLGNPKARGALRERIERMANLKKREIGTERTGAAAEVARLEKEVEEATRKLFRVPDESMADASAYLQKLKASLEAAKARLTSIHEEERQTISIDQAKADEALALVDELPNLLEQADEAGLRDALRSLVHGVTVHFAPSGHTRPTRGKTMYTLARVDVTLVPVFAAIIGGGLTSMGSHEDIRDTD
jgi:DNA invertase Pin-like site-specific DNA recombinase